MTPCQCSSILETHRQKVKSDRIKDASLCHVIAVAGGLKKRNGMQFQLTDFAPDLKEIETPEEQEQKVKMQLMKLAAAQSQKKWKESSN